MAKRTIAQLIEKHTKDAAFWQAKSAEYGRKALEATTKANTLRMQAAEAAGSIT